MEGIRFSN